MKKFCELIGKYFGVVIILFFIGGMTCRDCGCFVQFRVRHKTASCINGKW